MKKLILFAGIILSFNLSYSQSLKNNLGLPFGGSTKEVYNSIKKTSSTGMFMRKNGQSGWDVKVSELGHSKAFLMFENNRLVSALVNRDCNITETKDLYNSCLKAFGIEEYMSEEDLYTSPVGVSNERQFNHNGITVNIYIYKYGGFKFFGGNEVRSSVVINFYGKDTKDTSTDNNW